MRDILTQGLTKLGLTPPPGGVDKLCRYADLLLEQNQVMNLTAITQPDQVARLHFLDSAAVALWKGPGWLAGKRLIDVGTGAGFPGLVLKLLEPTLQLTLADSLGKRVRWLETVCDDLGLTGVTCLHARAEELALDPHHRDRYDVATSRAVATYPLLTELCLPFVKPGGVFLAMKSVESGEEVAAGKQAVAKLGGRLLSPVDYPIPGTDVVHRLVGAEKLSPTPKGYPRAWGKIKKNPL